jgi:hypothetical protein
MFNPTPTIYKYDRFIYGFIPGMIAPLIVLCLIYLLAFNYMSVKVFLTYLSKPVMLSPSLSLGVVLNLFIFFPLIQKNYYNAGRGVIGATILYGIPIIISKFFPAVIDKIFG